jgi:hypothetical protein
MVARHPRAHLIVGTVAAGTSGTAARMLTQLLRLFNLERNWAARAIRDGRDIAVQCAFEAKADADKIANALLARPVVMYPGWASQHHFRVNRKARKAIAAGVRTHKIREGQVAVSRGGLEKPTRTS